MEEVAIRALGLNLDQVETIAFGWRLAVQMIAEALLGSAMVGCSASDLNISSLSLGYGRQSATGFSSHDSI